MSEIETVGEARRKALDHLGNAIDKFQDADEPVAASDLESVLKRMESKR